MAELRVLLKAKPVKGLVRKLIWEVVAGSWREEQESERCGENHYGCVTEVSTVGSLGSAPVGTL